MNEDVLAAVVGSDEAPSFGDVEPLALASPQASNRSWTWTRSNTIFWNMAIIRIFSRHDYEPPHIPKLYLSNGFLVLIKPDIEENLRIGHYQFIFEQNDGTDKWYHFYRKYSLYNEYIIWIILD